MDSIAESYAERERRREPRLYERVRLISDVAATLRVALEERGLSMADLARRLGKGRRIVSRQLGGSENLSLGKLAELAYALGLRFEFRIVPIAESADNDRRGRGKVVLGPWPGTAPGPGLRFSGHTGRGATKHPTAA